jgi:hypothetical protein
MKILKFSFVLAVIALIHSTASANPRIVVLCKTFDLVTKQEKTAFLRGEYVLVVVKYGVTGAPGIPAGAKITVTANASLQIPGLPFPITLNPSVLQAPNTNPENGGSAVETPGTQSTTFRVPKGAPRSSAVSVFVTVSIPGFAPGSCNTTLHVVP